MDIITLALAKKYVQKTIAETGGIKGDDGKSAYQIALDNGFSGTEYEWLESLQGSDGITPTIGENGNWYLGNTDTGKPSRGEKGDTGEKGEKGDTGATGAQGSKGDTGPQGPKGDTGMQGPIGEKGDKGADGHTPVKGIDYFTEEDKTELVNAVLAALPAAEGVSY